MSAFHPFRTLSSAIHCHVQKRNCYGLASGRVRVGVRQTQAVNFQSSPSGLGHACAGHSVYVILLHDVRRHQRWGLYVGQTSRDPDWRFDQHKAGYKASASVRRFGVCVLPELVQHLNPMLQWEPLDLEAALADAFRAAGVPWVEEGH